MEPSDPAGGGRPGPSPPPQSGAWRGHRALVGGPILFPACGSLQRGPPSPGPAQPGSAAGSRTRAPAPDLTLQLPEPRPGLRAWDPRPGRPFTPPDACFYRPASLAGRSGFATQRGGAGRRGLGDFLSPDPLLSPAARGSQAEEGTAPFVSFRLPRGSVPGLPGAEWGPARPPRSPCRLSGPATLPPQPTR